MHGRMDNGRDNARHLGGGGGRIFFGMLPKWHETDYQADDLLSLKQISQLPGAPLYDAMRSYSTQRRTHVEHGKMPEPVARLSNRRVWLKREVFEWLGIP